VSRSRMLISRRRLMLLLLLLLLLLLFLLLLICKLRRQPRLDGLPVPRQRALLCSFGRGEERCGVEVLRGAERGSCGAGDAGAAAGTATATGQMGDCGRVEHWRVSCEV